MSEEIVKVETEQETTAPIAQQPQEEEYHFESVSCSP